MSVAHLERRWAIAPADHARVRAFADEIKLPVLLAQLLHLLPNGTWNERARLPLLAAYLYLLAFLAGLVPGDFLTKGGVL